MKEFEQLLTIAKRKSEFDQTNSWSNGAATYLNEIKKEVDEVIEEIPRNRSCYLEDELGDVLWDYLNILCALESEAGVDIRSVLARACKKYEERISGIESGKLWKDIKEKQKSELANEQSNKQST
ncbi:MazG nucleotide pyrophosphohydrolase domain-containing protein [Pseudoalteromonas sp. PS5]|uniref:MazG nucleotide pyrophosphohydrolase domain-containing protein n=1 Tax=Pseudoalteromonas sp. PS5 TaxID=1437473 RepID=UPI000FFE7C13|nr:MazG nucleotide pyrophosphohydrolase domain-containing protein [Pseudoalteromonas sp. PS5]RXF03946.1 nucleotide pyrophosphohydrolase [Pseudoalteromonas sp. PS5]